MKKRAEVMKRRTADTHTYTERERDSHEGHHHYYFNENKTAKDSNRKGRDAHHA